MISQPKRFSAADLVAIRAVSVGGLTSDSWADKSLKSLRTRAKKHYVAEQQNRCCYCAQQWLTEHGRVWDLEHVVPRKTRPDFMFEPRNLAAACPDCNNAKSSDETLIDPRITLYPTSSGAFAVIHPHFDRWEDHINRNGLVYRPITDKGTWTVKHCKLGRFAVKYLDPTDETDPFDERFESAVADLTSDSVTAQAALSKLLAYLAAGPAAQLP